MKHSPAIALATCFAAVSLAMAALAVPATALAAAQRLTDFADKSFSARDIVSALKPNRSRGLTLGDGGGTSEEAGGATTPSISLQLRFGRNSAELSADAKRRLETVAAALTGDDLAGTSLVVSGHTDVTGTLEHNVALSKRRAESVKAYLVALGVAAGRLKAVGRGPSDLLDEEHPTSPVNRRVQLAVAS